ISGDGSSGLSNYNVRVLNNLFPSDDTNGNHYGINLHNFGTHSIVSGNTLHEVHTGIFLDSQERAIVSNNIIINAKNRGIYLYDAANDNLIEGNLISGAPTGIKIDIIPGKRSNDRNLILGNQIRDCDTGILVNGANDTVILDNYLYNVNIPINVTASGINTTIRDNRGFLTENSGTTSTGTSIVVNHGLAGTPTNVIITPLDVPGYYYVTSKGPTSFTIISELDIAFDWYAIYKP
ncbi:MAG: right-handed parallel beta-helix repeat-containing protein, partial [Thermoplasmata archaeon]